MPKIVNVPRNKLPPRLEDPRVAVSYLARAAHPHGQQTGDLAGAALLEAVRVRRGEAAQRNLLEVTA